MAVNRRGRRPACRIRVALLALAATLLAAVAHAAAIDAAASQVGFHLVTRWGQSLDGRFNTIRGAVDDMGGDLRRVRLILSTSDVEIVGHPGYTRFARGSGFFDAERWPLVEFISDPYPPELLQTGGALGGTLRMRGVQRREVFVLQPAGCARPGIDCDVVASGRVRRGDYGMRRWRVALGDDVRFSLRMRLRAEPGQ
ncbi:YceI family protein [Luteimonas sp. 8-5]|uniref:YceI family protein n=1 Tax=Luteimonas sp. 8-5 TaxID=3039387 RepID=UPI002436CA87|nr:YceI family protein [Luteimonas sp. 8-5]MDG6347354.1 YceI family protein [Luteimonas sp. 8-5]